MKFVVNFMYARPIIVKKMMSILLEDVAYKKVL